MATATIAPQKKVTFTITKRPHRTADRKTIQRLMRMQPEIQRGLRDLARRRRQFDNKPGIRAGVVWVDRAKATKLTQVQPGETFTLYITPQIIPDIESVEQFLEAKPAK
jgi:hypothetical protein